MTGDSSQFVLLDTIHTRTLPWQSITGKPTALSQFINDLQPTLISDTLRIGGALFVKLPTTISWDSVTGHPTKLSQFNNDLQPSISGDTLWIGGSRYALLPSTIAWDSVTGHPTRLGQFTNDLSLQLVGTTLYVGGNQYVSLDTLMTRSLPWGAISGRPTRLSQFTNDLMLYMNQDTLFLGDTNNYVIIDYPIPITWNNVLYKPEDLSDFNNDVGYLNMESQSLSDVIAINDSANGQIKNLTSPSDMMDAVNKFYVDYNDSILIDKIDSLSATVDSLRAMIEALEHPTIEGQLAGKFSIAVNKQVFFSRGNLQFHSKMKIFKFAEHQYDVVGSDNDNAIHGSYYNGWLDLFGYGTSTWEGGRTRYMPYETSTNNDEYTQDAMGNDLTGIYVNGDWGRYNAISNGGCQPSQWRTLTQDEWIYLLSQRQNATNLKTLATVAGVKGLVLLPDSWTLPAGINLVPNVMSSYSLNVYSNAQWLVLEQAGAVFLPVAGYRDSSTTASVNVNGYYWSSTHVDALQSSSIHISTNVGVNNESTNCSRACSVRLVREY